MESCLEGVDNFTEIQRLITVAGNLDGWAVARINTVPAGGSSSSFSKAFAALMFNRSAGMISATRLDEICEWVEKWPVSALTWSTGITLPGLAFLSRSFASW